MKDLIILGLLVAVIILTPLIVACTNANRVGSKKTISALDLLTYEKDPKTGICFAVLGSRTYYAYNVISITMVPSSACEKPRP